MRLDKPELLSDPEVHSYRFAIDGMLSEAAELVKSGRILEALGEYEEFQKNHPTLQIPADSWNSLCWQGALHGFAKNVLGACEHAVMTAPTDLKALLRDSRGLARAMVGDYSGAIEDFRAYVVWSKANNKMYDKLGRKREAWIRSLELGQNPFDEGTLETLRKEGID
jgi:hypothetical protein